MSRMLAPLVLGVGLKMYLDHDQTLRWVERLRDAVGGHPALTDGSATLFVLPTFPSLSESRRLLAHTSVALGAQDLAAEDAGAFTGEVSGVELRQVGCGFVEIAHAERRALFGEDDELIARKYDAARRNSLVPIVCVGEAEPGDPEVAAEECLRQLDAIVRTTAPGQPMVVAYEPVWAIGAARPASIAHVRHVCTRIRTRIDPDLARVIYGGSARPGMLPTLRGAADGLFLGRAAHDVEAVVCVLDECLSA